MEIKKETCKQRWSRKSKNAWTRSIGFCKVSDVVAQIKMKEAKVKARKNLFGLQYMDLFEQGSSEEVLDRCFALARQDIDPLQAEINSLKDKIAQIEAQIKGKLVQKKKYGTPSVAVTHVETTPPDYPSYRATTGLAAEDNIAFATPYYPSAPPHEELRARLNDWYHTRLNDALVRGVVCRITTLFQLHFAEKEIDATSILYFEGDYLPGVLEEAIKTIAERSGQGGPVDEDAETKEIMEHVKEVMKRDKASFIVGFFNGPDAKKEDMAVHTDNATNIDDCIGNVSESLESVNKDGETAKAVDDSTQDIPCEIWASRQTFLKLCQENHYQFDELRRAKHAWMMITDHKLYL